VTARGYTQGVPHETFIVRFPNGDADRHSGFRAPSLGDTITKRRKRWTVVHVAEDTAGCVGVTVMPAEMSRPSAVATTA
jgi:hypothetical protein